ncbi:hypothetical protein C8J57DRAFT_1522803 [Mycena rebaudengoi]|nr:hypothetical protein C8J57DRAFT_1522803 [Mycena rebaudengoi]
MPANALHRANSSEQLRTSLQPNNIAALRFVAYSLGLELRGVGSNFKKPFIGRLIAWRYTMPLIDEDLVPLAINIKQLKFIQSVIADTETPAWIGSVPRNYGERNAGTIKAAEWRILATIYLTIALILLWGDHDVQNARALQILDHTMVLFTAVTVVCRHTMTAGRADT